jgi:hypothetical protein
LPDQTDQITQFFSSLLGSGRIAKVTLRCQTRNNAMRYWLDVDLPGAPQADGDTCPF